jgi:2-oxoisovalerate dehydrogenase E1 component alpha subunit
MREVTKRARSMALAGGGKPVLIEAMSYRVSHHSTSDDSFAYRARVEVEDWKRRDNPITRLRKYLEATGAWSEDLEKTARADLRRDILTAFARAEKLRKPPLRAMFEDVYEDLMPETRVQMEELRSVIERYPDEYDVSEFDGGLETLK